MQAPRTHTPTANGCYTSRLKVEALAPHQGEHALQQVTFEIPLEMTILVAEERVTMQTLRYLYGQQAITVIDYLYMCVFGAQQAALEAQQSLGSTLAWAGQQQGSQAALRQQAEVFKRSHAKMICSEMPSVSLVTLLHCKCTVPDRRTPTGEIQSTSTRQFHAIVRKSWPLR